MPDIRPRGHFPPVEILLACFDVSTLEPPDTNDPLELEQHRRHAMRTRLVDARLHAARLVLRGPALAIEESRCPCELVPIHARVKTTSKVLLSVPRPSHVHATRAAISCDEAQSSMSFLPAKPDSRSCQ